MDALDRREVLARGAGALLAAGVVELGWLDGALEAAPRPGTQLAALDRSIRGSVVVPRDPAYATARLPYNTRFDSVRPRAIVYPETAADVATTIGWARRHGVRLAARSGGHSYAGYSQSRGLIVDLSRMRSIRVDPARRLVTVGAGARLIDVYAALWGHRLTIPAGSCPTVGIGGSTLGGGVGFASRKLGLTLDNLRELTIVTADGRVRTCSTRRNADLFWACRGGGGGNFGIVTRFVFRAHPVGNVSTFRVQWPWSDADTAVRAWQAWAPHAPDGLFSVLQLAAPGSGPSIGSAGQFFGSETALRSLLAPLAAAGSPIVSVRTRSYWDATLHWAGCSDLAPCRVRGQATFAAKSDYVKRPLSARGIDTLARFVERRAGTVPGRGSVLLDSYGGAIRRVPRRATAFAHRDSLYGLQYLAYWDAAGQGGANLGWLRSFHAAMRPFVSGGAYVNYIDPDLRSWEQAYYGVNLARLRRVKRRYDPDRLFRFKQGIRSS